MSKHLLCSSLFFICSLLQSQQKKICITVDDIPAVTYNSREKSLALNITENLIRSFKKYNIPAIGYVVEGQLYNKNGIDSSKVEILEMWLKNKLELGNHTFSHHSYNKVPDITYFNDILKGEKVTSLLCKKYDSKLRFFRHPYLHTGSDSISNSKLHTFLTTHNYQEAPITIDTEDYLFAKAYQNAYNQNDFALMKSIGKSYVIYMEEKLLFFERKSIEVFDTTIIQTVLVHGSLLNAHYMSKLAKMYQKNGYEFASQKEALNDPAYSTPISVYSKKGDSWIYRWALSKGFESSIMNGDIKTPEEIIRLSNL